MTQRRHGGLQITGFSKRWLQEAGGRPRIRRLKAKRNQQLPSTTTTESMKSNDGGHFLTPFTHNQAKKTLSKTLKPSILSLNSCQGGAEPKYSRILLVETYWTCATSVFSTASILTSKPTWAAKSSDIIWTFCVRSTQGVPFSIRQVWWLTKQPFIFRFHHLVIHADTCWKSEAI